MLNRYYRKKFDKEKMLQDASILTRNYSRTSAGRRRIVGLFGVMT